MDKELEQNFVKLLERHQNIVHKICSMYTDNESEHRDLFQDITVQLWKAYPKFRGDAKFSTWMYRVALNTAITVYRKQKRKIQTQDIEKVGFKLEANYYDDTTEQNLKLMYAAVKELNDIDKALVLMYLDGNNYKQISDSLGITEVNARVKMNRIKKKLKTVINP